MVLSDPVHIHQVLMNLCTNAAHAMREKGGVLKVSLSEMEIDTDDQDQHPDLVPGQYLKLSVSDTGHGIDPSVMERIFEPFFTTKDRSEGTGMGLSVVHGIAKSCGGVVEVDTESGKGTTFHVFFPKTESEKPVQTEPASDLPTGEEHVFLVDDEKTMVDSVKAMLKHLGYKVTARTSSIEALEAFRAKSDGFDLVITDQTMPNMGNCCNPRPRILYEFYSACEKRLCHFVQRLAGLISSVFNIPRKLNPQRNRRPSMSSKF